jgi:hypothetical protein
MTEPSTHFRETPPHEVSRTETGERFVVFDCETSHIDGLLRFIRKDSEQQPSSWKDLQSILYAGEKCQFIHIPDLVRPYVYEYVDDWTAWEIAIFASRHNFQDIFKLAVIELHNVDWPEPGRRDKMPISCLEDLSIGYARALVTAMHKHKGCHYVNEEERWRDISESFKLEDD